jgi:hypothetical protein
MLFRLLPGNRRVHDILFSIISNPMVLMGFLLLLVLTTPRCCCCCLLLVVCRPHQSLL